ncbi:MAG: hypothetical protein IKU25_05615 [Clostridia bacterium]|nr:hypothetical protein [Clostridia bacterium]
MINLIWTIFFLLSLFAIVLAFVLILASIGKYGKRINAIHILFGLCFVLSVTLALPAYFTANGTDALGILKSIVVAFQKAIRVFAADGIYAPIVENISAAPVWIAKPYLVITYVTQFIAPLLAVSFVLSFFKNVSAYVRYLMSWRREIYVFSRVNERSLALAKDVLADDPMVRIVFTVTSDGVAQVSEELMGEARALGAICFKKDITEIKFGLHSKKKRILFFTMSGDDIVNVNDSLKLISIYNNRAHTRLYIFSKGTESELLLAGKSAGKMKIHRIDEVRSLVTRILYEKGDRVFARATPVSETLKHISAVVVGMGGHGTEMVKALSWYGQMDGYLLNITAFDRDKAAADKFEAQAPGLIKNNYGIEVKSDVDVDTKKFADEISKLTDATYVFVSLGSDEKNVATAVMLRMLFERMNIKPIIQTVVYNSNARELLSNARKSKAQSYDIEFVGDINSLYSKDVIIASALEKDAFARHVAYCYGDKEKEDDFWKYEYCYRSSIATAVHAKARISCNIPGAGKSEDEMTDYERETLGALEHRRWEAYMRADGYVYSGSPERSSRNDLGKMHNNLTDELTDDDKAKDYRVSAESKK